MVERLYLYSGFNPPRTYTDFVEVYRRVLPNCIIAGNETEAEYLDAMQLLCGRTNRIVLFQQYHDEVYEMLINKTGRSGYSIQDSLQHVAATFPG